jgi:hypothetical protein
MKNAYRINHRLEPGQYRLEDVFTDIRTYDILSEIFADAKEIYWVVANIKVIVLDEPFEVFVDNNDATIYFGLKYLRCCHEDILYLDIIHELCHVKQHLQGRNLYDERKAYVDRETEIEAWITPEEHKRLARRLNVITS